MVPSKVHELPAETTLETKAAKKNKNSINIVYKRISKKKIHIKTDRKLVI